MRSEEISTTIKRIAMFGTTFSRMATIKQKIVLSALTNYVNLKMSKIDLV